MPSTQELHTQEYHNTLSTLWSEALSSVLPTVGEMFKGNFLDCYILLHIIPCGYTVTTTQIFFDT